MKWPARKVFRWIFLRLKYMQTMSDIAEAEREEQQDADHNE